MGNAKQPGWSCAQDTESNYIGEQAVKNPNGKLAFNANCSK